MDGEIIRSFGEGSRKHIKKLDIVLKSLHVFQKTKKESPMNYEKTILIRDNNVDEVDEINDNTSCPAVALSCTQLAAKLSAAVLYKYSRNTNLV